MAEDGDREFLLSIFLMEAWDTVAHLEDGLARLPESQAVGAARFHPLLVVTHRLKGAAALHGCPGVAELAAATEQLLPTMARLPVEERRRAIDFLAELVPELKRQLDRVGAVGAEDGDGLAAFRSRHPGFFASRADGTAASADVTPGTPAPAGGLRAELDRFFVENADVLEYFTPEAVEHLESMTTALLALEQKGRSDDELGRLFRAVHTLKGAAYTVGCTVVGDLAHRMEDLLAAVREDRLPLSDEVVEPIFRAIDALRVLLRLSAAADVDLDGLLGRTLEELDGLLARAQPADAADATPVAPPDAVDHPAEPPLRAPVSATAPGFRPTAVPSPAPRPAEVAPVVRVSLERLDALMNLVGELVIARSRLDTRLGELDRLGQLLLVSRARMARAAKSLEARLPATGIGRAEPAGPDGGDPAAAGLTSFADLFDELEFDRYDDVDIFARSVAELSADVTEIQGQLATLGRTIREDTDRIQRLTGTLRDQVTRARLVPIGRLFARFGRHVREASRTAGKAVGLEVSGDVVEVDNTVIDAIADPLLHIVQNAIAHGIEPEGERQAAGKSPHGTVRLSAAHRAGAVYVDVEDDGRGIDAEVLKEQAVRQGYLSSDEARGLSPRQALELIFLPGFSTAVVVTTAAGRGVGLDVVRTNLARIGGEIAVTTTAGVGTRFTLKLPLTVVVSQALMVRAGPESFALPLNVVAMVVAARDAAIQANGRGESVRVGDRRVPLYRLHRLLDLAALEPRRDGPVVVVRAGGALAAILVDEIAGKQEVVIKSLSRFLEGLSPFAGATISGEGRVILLLDAGRLAALGERPARGAAPARPAGPMPLLTTAPAQAAACRVMLVDDSVSIRKVVGHMLEKAGFRVFTANDGADALQQLGDTSVHLLITDLEMPRVNGYELIEDLRRRPATRDLPIVVLTTRTGEKHLSLARRLGVQHYVGKPVDEQTFVRLIRSLSMSAPAEPELVRSGP